MGWYREQPLNTVFAHFYPIGGDYHKPLTILATHTSDVGDAWAFRQPRFQSRHAASPVPKLRNYLNYTFLRLIDLEQLESGKYFRYSSDQDRICFNTGLQNIHGSDLLATFQRYKPRTDAPTRVVPDWVYKGCFTASEPGYRSYFGKDIP